jgi:hypothetical protein
MSIVCSACKSMAVSISQSAGKSKYADGLVIKGLDSKTSPLLYILNRKKKNTNQQLNFCSLKPKSEKKGFFEDFLDLNKV